MRRLGFGHQWIHLIMKCVTLVTYEVLVNGNSYGQINPTRGIW